MTRLLALVLPGVIAGGVIAAAVHHLFAQLPF